MSFLNGTDPGLRQTRTPTVDLFTAGVDFTAGSSTQVTLTNDPGSENNVIITFDGIVQHRSTYSILASLVTFDAAIPTGVTDVEATYTTTQPAAEPADNSVTLAKLSDGTQGGLIYYAGSGAPTELAAGTSGQFLQTQGAGSNPVWATVSSDFVLLETQTASASSSLDFTTFDNATYSSYMLVMENLGPATDNVDFYLRTSADGGSTFDSGASDYQLAFNSNDTGSTNNPTGTSGVSFINLTYTGVGNAAGEDVCGHIMIYRPGASEDTRVTFETVVAQLNGNIETQRGGGYRNSTAAVDAVRILASSGNITDGRAKLYGLK
ncbi:MAG: hypothetical protein VW333_08085 [Pseudomonadales bacterium]